MSEIDWLSVRTIDAQFAEIERLKAVQKEAVAAIEGLIVALRTQARLATACGGDIALNEGNAAAWDKAREALKHLKGDAK